MFTALFSTYLVTINIVAAYMFWLDWRHTRLGLGIGEIPERIFLIISLLGGAFGVLLAQGILRHRMYRRRARVKYMLALSVHMLALAAHISINTLPVIAPVAG